MTENQHQIAIFKWTMQPHIRYKYPDLKLLFHVPNGGKRDPIEAKHLKNSGVKPGVPDLCLPVSRHGYHSLWIELKNETGRPSKEQKWWIEELGKQGCKASICHGWQEAVRLIEWYMSDGEV